MFREYLERTLPPGQSSMRLAVRFVTDPEFLRLTLPAMLAALESDRRREREEEEAFERKMQESHARHVEAEARRLEEEARRRGRLRRLQWWFSRRWATCE